MARTLMVHLPCLTRTCSWVHIIQYMRLLWPTFAFLFSCCYISVSIFSDRRSLKIENENNSTKTDRRSPIYRTRIPRAPFINTETYPGWLELPLTGTNFYGPEPVPAIEVLMYKYAFLRLQDGSPYHLKQYQKSRSIS